MFWSLHRKLYTLSKQRLVNHHAIIFNFVGYYRFIVIVSNLSWNNADFCRSLFASQVLGLEIFISEAETKEPRDLHK